MKNTFWTLIEDNYYRIEDKQLKYAPVNATDNTIILEDAKVVIDISKDILELINKEFNSSIVI